MEERQKTVWDTVEEWLSFIGWITLFLIGPAVPQLLDQARDEDAFSVLSDGPVYFSDRATLALEIQNNGRKVERDVEIWAPLPRTGDVWMETNPFDFSPPRYLRVRQQDEHRILGIGDLQPGERYSVSLQTTWKPDPDPARKYADIPWIHPKVVSAEHTARSLGWRFRAFREEMRVHWYSNALTLMTLAVVLLVLVLSRQAREP